MGYKELVLKYTHTRIYEFQKFRVRVSKRVDCKKVRTPFAFFLEVHVLILLHVIFSISVPFLSPCVVH